MTRWKAGVCPANGINIHYLRTGGDKIPIILLHGLMTNGSCWSSLAQELEEDYDVIMPDARGHGNSSAPNEGYSYGNLASDIETLIQTLELDTPLLLGHSMGGMTAAVVASRNPKQLRGLVLVEPTFLTPQHQHEVYKSDIAAQHSQILSRSKENFLAEIRTRNSRRSSELVELLTEARFQTSIHAFEILKPLNPDYVQLIKSLHIPSLLIIGDAGAVVSLEMATELAKLNPCLEVVQITNAGHGVPFDEPERFSSALKSFLRSFRA